MKKLSKWKILEEKDISPSKFFPLFLHKIELPSGKIIPDYYVSRLGEVAMVVAITPEREIIFVEQYKHGVQEIIMELPAGRIDNSTPEEAAKRELLEETGVVAEELLELEKVAISPTKDSTITHGFLAQNVVISKEQNLDENEDINIIKIPINKVKGEIIAGDIYASDTIAMIYLAFNKYPNVFENNSK